MAVVQISRIQHRRGKKNVGTGFPQLASGELGWAIDTQELYIGNGSVSEGSPAVGNTKVITEHDDILQLAETYEYKNGDLQTSDNPNTPFKRSLQERLDDIVSVRAFGITGDGTTDVTMELQRAIDELFLNLGTIGNPTSRVVLYIEAGKYIISDEIKIPPYAHIVGAGIDSTIIEQTLSAQEIITAGHFQIGTSYTIVSLGNTNFVTVGAASNTIGTTFTATGIGTGTGTVHKNSGYAVFRMIDSQLTAQNDYREWTSINSLTRPRYIHIEGMTLSTTTDNTILYLDDTESTVFDRVKFLGSYNNGDTAVSSQSAVTIRGTSGVLRTDNVSFRDCQFEKTGFGIYSNSDHANVLFDHCRFYMLFTGIDIGNGIYGSIATKVSNCYFDKIDQYGFRVRKGAGNVSSFNSYISVGDDNEDYANATYPIVWFTDDSITTPQISSGVSVNDYFKRNDERRIHPESTNGFIPSVHSIGLIEDKEGFRATLTTSGVGFTGAGLQVRHFPIYDSGTYMIDYVIMKNSNNANGGGVRSGVLTITVNVAIGIFSMTDNYNYSGHSSVENVIFLASLENYLSDSSLDTLVLRYKNPIGNGTGTINMNYRMLSR